VIAVWVVESAISIKVGPNKKKIDAFFSNIYQAILVSKCYPQIEISKPKNGGIK